MLLNLKYLIKTIGNFLLDIRKMKDYEKIRNFNYQIVDSYGYFEVKGNYLSKQFGHSSEDRY